MVDEGEMRTPNRRGRASRGPAIGGRKGSSKLHDTIRKAFDHEISTPCPLLILDVSFVLYGAVMVTAARTNIPAFSLQVYFHMQARLISTRSTTKATRPPHGAMATRTRP
jgi:hypothetical protein